MPTRTYKKAKAPTNKGRAKYNSTKTARAIRSFFISIYHYIANIIIDLTKRSEQSVKKSKNAFTV
jgi:hypothetical protein